VGFWKMTGAVALGTTIAMVTVAAPVAIMLAIDLTGVY